MILYSDVDVTPLSSDPSLAMKACTDLDLALAAHEDGFRVLDRGWHGQRCQEHTRFQVRIDLDVSVKVGNRAVRAKVRFELDGTNDNILDDSLLALQPTLGTFT